MVKRSGVLRALVLAPFYYLRFTWFALKERSILLCRYYPGYHGSTLPSLKAISGNRQKIFAADINHSDGIDLNENNQLSLLNQLSEYYAEYQPEQHETPDKLYYYDNEMYGYNDGFILYSFLRHFQPGRVVEAGSGHSSALMIDTCEEFLPHTRLTFIDPWSTTIAGVLKKKPDKDFHLLRTELQDVPLDMFTGLNANDILFIDTSHVVKIGSDLSALLFSILPGLSTGVIVHIHDIWWPWEYPEAMLMEGRAYNEIYLVRSFLQYNKSFEILFFSSFLEKKHADLIQERMPGYRNGSGQSLWIRKSD